MQLLNFYIYMLSPNVKKHLNKLKQKKYRKEFEEFLIEGIKGIEEAFKEKTGIAVIIIDGSRREEAGIKEIIEKAKKLDIPMEFCGHKDIDDIKTTDTFSGVIAIVEQKNIEIDDVLNNSPILALYQINDPGNLGTIIRTADWFGIKNIILSENSVDPYNEKTARSTMGSIFRTNIYQSKSFSSDIGYIKKKGYQISALDMKGENLKKIQPNDKTVYIFGSESHGVPENLLQIADKVYNIEGAGNAESLNIAISAGILMSKLK